MTINQYQITSFIKNTLIHIFLMAVALTCLFPLFWMARSALMTKVPYYTTSAGALAAAQAIGAIQADTLEVRPIQDYAH